MKHHKAWVILVILAAVVVWISVIYNKEPQTPNNPKAADPAIEERHKIVRQENTQERPKEEFSRETITTHFSDDIIESHTHQFLLHLDSLGSKIGVSKNPLAAIHQYLLEQMPADQAEKMFTLYKRYLNYQMTLQEYLRNVGTPQSPEEALEQLADLQDYRRSVFGDEEADKLFGDDLATKEYDIKRKAILFDPELYGAEKEEKLKALADGMGGDNPAEADNTYNRYQDTLRLYEKDMAELSTDEERRDFMENLKLNVLDPVQRLALADTEETIKAEKQRKETYYALEKELLNDPDLTEEERTVRIHDLQNETFGDEAESFRRSETMQKELDLRVQAAREKRAQESQ